MMPSRRPSPRRRGRPVGRGTPALLIRGVGVAGILAGAAMALTGYFAPTKLPLRDYYNLTATFERADGLVDHTDVKMGGVRIGQVLDSRIENRKVVARLQLDGGTGPLRSDLTLRVRPRGLLGVVYVEIVPGLKGEMLADNGRIPESRSTNTVQLDDVLATFDAPTRGRTQTLLRELGKGVAGRGDDVNQLLGQGPGYLENLTSVAQAVNARPGSATRFVQGAASALGALDPAKDELTATFDPAARALAPFRTEADDWRSTLEQSPQTLSQARTNLAATDPLLRSVDRLSRRLDVALRPAPEAFNDTAKFFAEARPALMRVPKTLTLARQATSPTVSLARRVDAQLPLLARGLVPGLSISKEVAPHSCDLRSFLGHWAEHDALGDEGLNYLRATVTIGSRESLGTDPVRRDEIFSNPYPAPCQGGWEHLSQP